MNGQFPLAPNQVEKGHSIFYMTSGLKMYHLENVIDRFMKHNC